MADRFLQRIRAATPIVDSGGRAVNAFVRFWDTFAGTIERQVADLIAVNLRQDAADIAIEGAVTAVGEVVVEIADVLNGTTPFTGINVGGVNVKPFLDRTDGSKIDDSAALGDGLVSTVKITPFAVTNEVTTFTAAQLNLAAGPTTLSTVQSAILDVNGGNVVLSGNFYLRALIGAGSFTTNLVVERLINGVTTTIYNVSFDSAPLTGADQMVGWIPVTLTDAPGVGTAYYYLRIKFNQTGWSTLYVASRALSLREFKR